MNIYLLLYLLIALVLTISIISYKKGIYLIWIILLFVPTIMLEVTVLKLSVLTIILVSPLTCGLLNNDNRRILSNFILKYWTFFVLYFIVSLSVALLSQTVSISYQIRRIFEESVILIFCIQTFLFLRNEDKAIIVLRNIIGFTIIANVIYCIIFEILLRFNPAGMPLYILLGLENNEFIVDMIDSVRGDLDFRAQTIYRHPLSLGQYMLVFLPLFLTKGKVITRLLMTVSIFILIVLSGTRGALFPMLIVIVLHQMVNMESFVRKIFIFVSVFILMISLLPESYSEKMNHQVKPFIAALQFWDENKQDEYDIKGSSIDMRMHQVEAAFKEIADNPIFGRGYGYREYWQSQHHYLHPQLLGYESIFLYYLVERGWLGLLFFFFMIYYMYIIFTKKISDKTTIRLVYIGFVLSIIMTGIRPLSLLFVFLVCSLASAEDSKKRLIVRYNDTQNHVIEV